MPGTLPTARPVFVDEELRGGYATPVLLRKMIDWCRYSYARDLPYVPCDPMGRRPLDQEVPNHSDRQSAAAAWFVPFGSFYVPDPLSPARRLKVQVYATGTISGTDPMEILLTSNRGLTSTLTLESADAWVEFAVPAAPDSVVTIQARSPGTGADKHLAGFCAHWEEPSALVPGMSVDTTGIPLPSEDFPAQNRAASVALLRSMARWMNRMTCRTVRQVVAKWHGLNYRSIASPTPLSWVARRYKVWISDNADTLNFRWTSYDTGTTATVTVEVTGGASITVPAADAGTTLAVTAGAGRLEEIVVTISTTTAGEVALVYFTAEEGGMAAAARPLPSGESAPGTMPALSRDLIRAESSIVATGETGWRDVLLAQRFILDRVTRSLVKDNDMVLTRSVGLFGNVGAPWGLPGLVGGASEGVQDSIIALGGAPTWTRYRVRAAVHGRTTDAALPASVTMEHWSGEFVALVLSETLDEARQFQATAPKAAIDSPFSPTASAGEKVQQWPQWVSGDHGHDQVSDIFWTQLRVNQTDGLYEAEWAGSCVELYVPEGNVP